MTVSEILQLTAAGFSKAEILAMGKTGDGTPEEKKEVLKPEEKKEVVTPDFAAALDAINKRLDALAEKKAEPEKKEEPEKKDSTDVLALLQAMNMNGQRYDLPPQYDPEKALAGALDAVMNGEKRGEEKNG